VASGGPLATERAADVPSSDDGNSHWLFAVDRRINLLIADR
jgi:hypothetical protein